MVTPNNVDCVCCSGLVLVMVECKEIRYLQWNLRNLRNEINDFQTDFRNFRTDLRRRY